MTGLSRKRMSAEFVVIVAGVLVALAVDAGWGTRQDREREVAYLRLLVASSVAPS